MSGVRGQVSGVRCHMSYDREKKYYVCVQWKFSRHTSEIFASKNFLVAWAKKKFIFI